MKQTLEGEKNTTEFDQRKEFMTRSTKKYFFEINTWREIIKRDTETKILAENKEALKFLSSEQKG